MTFLSKIALPALALALAAPVALHAQSSNSSNSGSTNAGSTASPTGSSSTAPQTTKKHHHHKTKAAGDTMNTTSQPMTDGSMQPPDKNSIAKPGTDPVNPSGSPEPPVPTTQGPPPPDTTPNTNQAAPHF